MAKMSKQVRTALVALLIASPQFLFAQGSMVSGALEKYYDTGYLIGNVLFAIFMVFGIVKTIAAFVSGKQNAVSSLLMVVVAAVLWFGFDLIMQDVMSVSGSSASGGGFVR